MHPETEALYTILHSVYGDAVNAEMLEIKHFHNPHRPSTPVVITYQSDEPVGATAFLGMRLKLKDQILTVSQACDTAVIEKERGRGFLSHILRTEEHVSDAAFSIGLPNKKSFSRYLSSGWHEVVRLKQFARFYPPLACTGNASSALEITLHRNCPFDEEDFRLINAYVPVRFTRNTSFYQWKQAYQPEPSLSYISCRKKGALVGMLVVHRRNRLGLQVLIIDDWYMCPEISDDKSETGSLSSLFNQMLSALPDIPAILLVPFVNPDSPDYSFWKANGFFPIPGKEHPLIVSARGTDYPAFRTCCIRNIDSDVL